MKKFVLLQIIPYCDPFISQKTQETMTNLIDRWQRVCRQIQASCQTPDAQPRVCLIAVSKTFPAADIRTLYQVGQRDFGENYIQEFADKTTQLADLNIIWHMIGQVQSNKSRVVAERAHWVHTLDREKIAHRLNDQRPASMPPLNVCIEVNIANEASKHGIAPQAAAVLSLAEVVAGLPHLRLRGLMCVAQANSDVDSLRRQFSHMRILLQSMQDAGFAADVLSMGMSGDMDTAIACGATHVRVGSAIFGHRHYTEKD